jgi:hypothetical protein
MKTITKREGLNGFKKILLPQTVQNYLNVQENTLLSKQNISGRYIVLNVIDMD